MTDHANLLAEIDLLGEKLAQAKACLLYTSDAADE